MKALVTGGTGFLGSHIVDELVESGYDVRVMVRKSSKTTHLLDMNVIELVVGDITQPKTLPAAMKEIEVVFNNAAVMEDWGSWSKFSPVNVDGTRNVLEAARKQDILKIAHTSSTAVYGFPNSKEGITEGFPKNPVGNYQKSKWAAEQVVDEYIDDYGMDIAYVRPPFILGSHDQYSTPLFVDAIQKGEMVIIGSGKQLQSFVHARDAAQCLRLIVETPNTQGEAYNVTSFDLPAEELYIKYAELLDVKTDFRYIPYRLAYVLGAFFGFFGKMRRKKDSPLMTTFRAKLLGTNYLIDSTKAREQLGYVPRFDFETTVRDSLQWYFSQHPNKPIPSSLEK
ncbi:MAG: NAD-dependent epimerase/dehydratase family protein [Promethearchaeota archaeon]